MHICVICGVLTSNTFLFMSHTNWKHGFGFLKLDLGKPVGIFENNWNYYLTVDFALRLVTVKLKCESIKCDTRLSKVQVQSCPKCSFTCSKPSFSRPNRVVSTNLMLPLWSHYFYYFLQFYWLAKRNSYKNIFISMWK